MASILELQNPKVTFNMSIIAVSGIPRRWSLEVVTKILINKINGQFEALYFDPVYFRKDKLRKTCYLRLSEKLELPKVLRAINRSYYGKKVKLRAFTPKIVPDIPRPKKKTRKISMKLCRALKIDNHTPHEVLHLTHAEFLMELQYKYPKLLELSKKTEHKLLEAIGRKILERLKQLMEGIDAILLSCFSLSKMYRESYPHEEDFQFVLSTLHSIQEAAGQPREELRATELAEYSLHHTMIENLPIDKVHTASQKYSDRINRVVSAYVRKLNTQITSEDTEDDIARKKVRQEMKKMKPYLPTIIREVILNNFVPDNSPFFKIRIYGEPCLPPKDVISPFVRRFNPVYIRRSRRIFNMLKVKVPPSQATAIYSMDSSVINGVKLTIRSSYLPIYEISSQLRSEINAVYGGEDFFEEELSDDEDSDMEL